MIRNTKDEDLQVSPACAKRPVGGSAYLSIKRAWSMPTRHTFLMKPVKQLINKYTVNGKNWIDPFAGENSIAEITNDLNEKKPTTYHLKAESFLRMLLCQGEKFDGVFFDPPYSLTQLKECYENVGVKIMQDETNFFPSKERKLAAQLIKNGGYAICCGWSTQGIGKKYGFKLIEILLVCHGRGHNDTIITVEQKLQSSLF